MQLSGNELQRKSTLENFSALRSMTVKSRMTSLHSYDVLDNPSYKKAKVIEAKILKMQAALKMQQATVEPSEVRQTEEPLKTEPPQETELE